jgi:hypothetical protein
MAQLAPPCPPQAPEPPETPRAPRKAPRLWWEIALVAVFYGAYTLVRLLIPHEDATAYAHADQIMRLEHALGPNVERAFNHALLHVPTLARLANIYYATAHFVVTLAVLTWLYRRRPEHYRWLRASLMLATAIALIGFWVYPLAPPRFLAGQGFVDPVTAFHTVGLYSSTRSGSVTNQFAAMPSMHAGWALWCAVAVIICARRPLTRALAALYPIVTITVIFATANHYLLDAVAGIVVVVFALFVGLILHLRENGRRTAEDHEVTNKTTILDSTANAI